jgi:hypothetical protein
MSTTALVFIPLIVSGLSLIAIAPVIFKLYRRCRIEEITPEWLENFSPSSYYPMEGLLSKEDFHFLSRQPGFDLSLHRKLRRDRLHIFRQYLSRLIRDFNRLHTAARILLAHGQDDRSELVFRLIWLKIRFTLAVVEAEVSYLFCCVGFRTLAVRGAILHLEEMSAHLGSISASQAA